MVVWGLVVGGCWRVLQLAGVGVWGLWLGQRSTYRLGVVVVRPPVRRDVGAPVDKSCRRKPAERGSGGGSGGASDGSPGAAEGDGAALAGWRRGGVTRAPSTGVPPMTRLRLGCCCDAAWCCCACCPDCCPDCMPTWMERGEGLFRQRAGGSDLQRGGRRQTATRRSHTGGSSAECPGLFQGPIIEIYLRELS